MLFFVNYVTIAQPIISSQPEDTTNICPGSTVTFSVTASSSVSSPLLSFYWSYSTDGGNTWNGCSETPLNTDNGDGSWTSVLPVSASQNALYRCTVDDGGVDAVSDVATLELDNTPPVFAVYLAFSRALGATNDVTVYANEVVRTKLDNCTSPDQISFYFKDDEGNKIYQKTYTCDNLLDNQERVYAEDEQGNVSYIDMIIAIMDMTSPTMEFSSDTFVTEVARGETYTVSGTEFDPVCADNCDNNPVVLNSLTNTASLNGAQLSAGENKIYWSVTDASYNTTVDSIVIVVNEVDYTSIDDKDNILSIYPNPASNFLNITLAENYNSANVIITDLSGKLIKTTKINRNNENINISSLKPGIYLIRISTPGNMFVGRFIKQ